MACNSCKLARIKHQIAQRHKLAQAKAESERKAKEKALAAENIYALTSEEEKVMEPEAVASASENVVDELVEERIFEETVEEAPKKRSYKKKEVVEDSASAEEHAEAPAEKAVPVEVLNVEIPTKESAPAVEEETAPEEAVLERENF